MTPIPLRSACHNAPVEVFNNWESTHDRDSDQFAYICTKCKYDCKIAALEKIREASEKVDKHFGRAIERLGDEPKIVTPEEVTEEDINEILAPEKPIGDEGMSDNTNRENGKPIGNRELEGIDDSMETQFKRESFEHGLILGHNHLVWIFAFINKFAAKQVEAAIVQKVRDAYEHGYTNGVHSPSALTPRGEEIKARGYAEGAEAFRNSAVKMMTKRFQIPEQIYLIEAIKALPLPTDTTKA